MWRRNFITVFGATAMLLTLPAGGASAEEAPLSLFLSCTGNDVSYTQTGTDITAPSQAQIQHNRAAGLPPPSVSTSPRYGFVSTAGRMNITVQGTVVRVRPSPGSSPMLRRSADGWYALTDVSITDTEIRAKASWGALGKLKLSVDRRSGEVKFGNFTGQCEKTADDPAARKF